MPQPNHRQANPVNSWDLEDLAVVSEACLEALDHGQPDPGVKLRAAIGLPADATDWEIAWRFIEIEARVAREIREDALGLFVDELVDELKTRDCTCIGTCLGAGGLAEGYRCARLPCAGQTYRPRRLRITGETPFAVPANFKSADGSVPAAHLDFVSATAVKRFVGYETSSDYRKLWKLAKSQSVVCAYDLCPNGVVCVGASDLGDQTLDEFVAECVRVNLEWIVPTEERGNRAS